MLKSDNKKTLYFILAVSVWIISIVFVSVLVYIDPVTHSVTPTYHIATEKWLAGLSIYNDDYNYFPQCIYIFMPFHLVPAPFGDILWRVVQTGLLAWSVWRILSLLRSLNVELYFLYMSPFMLIQSLGAIRNGQANVFFAALSVHAAACLARSQWGWAALCLVGALTIKPLGIVMIALAIVVYYSIFWRIALGIAVFLVFPFCLTNPSYVYSQYLQAVQHLFSFSAHVTENRFADINGLLRALGMELTGSASQLVRIGAGLLTLVFWLVGAMKAKEPERALLLLALATTYLMLFNPMTEGNSYVIVAPVITVFAIRFLKIQRFHGIGWFLIFMGFSLGLLPELFRRVDKNFSLWWSPLMMLSFFVILIWTIFPKRFRMESPAGIS
jgi:alpha-1,2-mannosyltransferase